MFLRVQSFKELVIMRWNDERMKFAYDKFKAEFGGRGFSSDEIEDFRKHQLSAKKFKTASKHIKRMVMAAYYTGMLYGIHACDEMLYTMLSPSGEEPEP